MQVKIQTNAVDLGRQLSTLAIRQMPFAISSALNSVGRSARDREHGDIDEYFTLRSGWLKKKGAMPFVPSRKDNLTAIIGVADEVAALNAIGDTRPARAGKMAVPLSDTGSGKSARSVLNPGQETLGPSKWPSRIVRPAGKKKGRGARKAFILKSKSTGNTFVVQRDGESLDFLYTFANKVKIERHWPVVENVEAFVARNYDRIFTHALQHAINTAR